MPGLRFLAPGVVPLALTISESLFQFQLASAAGGYVPKIGYERRVHVVAKIADISGRPSLSVGEIQNDSGAGVELSIAVPKSFYQPHPDRF
jgi:hypothetical protein